MCFGLYDKTSWAFIGVGKPMMFFCGRTSALLLFAKHGYQFLGAHYLLFAAVHVFYGNGVVLHFGFAN